MSTPTATLPDRLTVVELRQTPRFSLSRDVAAFFDSLPVRLVDIGAAGLQIEHESGLRLGTRGTLTIESEEPLTMRAHVVWSHLQRGDRNAYRSGAAIDDDIDRIAGRLGRFVRANASPQSGSLQRKREAQRKREEDREVAAALPYDGTVSAILHARETLSRFPVEAMTLYERGRQALAGADSSAELYGSPHHIEAYAIYEVLEHRVPIATIVSALERQRK